MTTPGGTNVGTAYGKVRIDYESTGVGRAVKDVEALQESLVTTGKSAQGSAKQISKAQSQIVSSAQAATKALEKGLKVSAPLTISPSKVDIESGAITKALENFNKTSARKAILRAQVPLQISPSKVDVDRGSITRALDTFARNGITGPIKLRAAIAVEASDVSVDVGAIQNAVRQTQLGEITVSTPIRVTPSQVTVDRSAIQTGAAGAGGVDLPGGQGGRGRGGAGGAGALAAGGMLARLGPVGMAAGAAAAPVAGLGFVLQKGFTRLQGLDQAAVKLKALGKSTEEIAQISNTALESVEGTAFGLDEAFNVAAGAMNAGVKQGAELDKYMKAVAGTASLAGVSMLELGDAMQQAAVEGKVTGDVLDLLISRNVPALQLIAEEYGVTQQKAQQMVSNSEVSFDRFVNAMGKNKDAAKIMANTVGGSFNNLMASVSRIGAMLLAPLFGQATGEASNMAKIIQGLTQRLKEFEGFLGENKVTIINFWEDAAKGGILFGQHITNVIGFVLQGIGKLIEGIGHVPSAFAGIIEFFGGEGIADNLRRYSDNMTNWGNTVYDAGSKVHSFDDTLDRTWDNVTKWANGAREAANQTAALGSAAEEAAPQMISLAEALEKLGLKGESVAESVTGTNQEFLKLMETLERKEGTEALRNALQKLRDEWENGGRAVDSYETALENMTDQTIDASTKAQGLIDALQQLGILPGGDALSKFNEQFEEMTDYARELPDPLGQTGKALLDLNGNINTSTKNGRLLYQNIKESQEALYELAASGEVAPGEAYDRMAEGLRLRLADFGITGQEAQDLINKYLTPKQTFEANFSGKDPKTVIEEAFSDDPAKINSLIELLTTKEDILNELLGGPGSTLKIPAEIVTQPPSGPAPGGPAPQGPAVGPNSKDIPPEGIPVSPAGKPPLPPGMEYRRFPNGAEIPVPIGGAKPAAQTQLPKKAEEAIGRWESGETQPKEKKGLFGGTWDDWLPSGPKPHDKEWPLTPQEREEKRKFDESGKVGEYSQTRYQETPLDEKQLEALKNNEFVNEVLAQDYELQMALGQRQDEYEKQGKTLADAYADGILSGEEDVRNAIIKLATIAADGLGRSPAKYGPLSGRGWTYFRGQNFTSAYAEGIESQADSAKGAVSYMAGAATMPFAQQVETMIKDLQDLSSFGKLALDLGKQLSDIAFSGLRMVNDLSGGRLFPKTYDTDLGFDPRRGSVLGSWTPTIQPPRGAPGSPTRTGAQAGAQLPTGKVDPNAKGDAVAQAFIAQAQARGWNQEQILAGLGVLQQETDYGRNPATNNIQNQNGTPGITGVFQQDMGYRKYGDPRDVNNAITGFITEFENRGGMGQDPWDFAVSGVQKPANVGAGGYWDRSGAGAGAHLRKKQRDEALATYNRLVGSAPQSPAIATPSGAAGPNDPTDVMVGGKWYSRDQVELAADGKSWKVKAGQTATPATIPSAVTPGGAKTLADVNFFDMTGINLAGANQQIGWVAAIARDMFGLEMTSGKSNHSIDSGWHPKGQAGDFSNASGNSPEQAAFAKFMRDNFMPYIEQLIYHDPNAPGVNIYGGKPVKPGEIYDADTLDDHANHIHLAIKDGMAESFKAAIYGNGPLAPMAAAVDAAVGQPGGVMPFQNPWATSTPGALPPGLQQYGDLLGTNPKDKRSAITWLQSIDAEIADLNRTVESPERNAQLDALGQARSRVMGQFGLKEGPSMLDQAEGIVNGVAGLASGFMETFDAGIKYIGAWKTVSETLVRGISNTEDIMTLIDQWQIGLDFWNKVVQNASDIASFAGQFTGGADMGGVSAVGGALGMISQVMTAINTGIDLAQEGYRIATKYLGRFLTSWFGFPGAQDIKFLLDEVTGQLQVYTSENPQMKHTFNTLGRSLGKQYPERPTPTNQFVIYQGPGQDPRDTMDDAMYTVRASGVGAFGYGD